MQQIRQSIALLQSCVQSMQNYVTTCCAPAGRLDLGRAAEQQIKTPLRVEQAPLSSSLLGLHACGDAHVAAFVQHTAGGQLVAKSSGALDVPQACASNAAASAVKTRQAAAGG
jgi:hypothetical protein